MNKECPVCKKEFVEASNDTPGWESRNPVTIICLACGEYEIDSGVAREVRQPKHDQKRYIFSGVIRERNEKGEIPFRVTDLKALLEAYNSVSALSVIDRIIDYVYRKSPSAEVGASIHPDYEAPVAFAKSKSEFDYFLSKASEGKYIEVASEDTSRHCNRYRLGIEGLKRLPHYLLVVPQLASSD